MTGILSLSAHYHRNAVHGALGHAVLKTHRLDAASAGGAFDEVDEPIVAQAARRAADETGHQSRVKGVDADDDASAFGDEVERGLDALAVQLIGRHECHALGQRILLAARYGRADAAGLCLITAGNTSPATIKAAPQMS